MLLFQLKLSNYAIYHDFTKKKVLFFEQILINLINSFYLNTVHVVEDEQVVGKSD